MQPMTLQQALAASNYISMDVCSFDADISVYRDDNGIYHLTVIACDIRCDYTCYTLARLRYELWVQLHVRPSSELWYDHEARMDEWEQEWEREQNELYAADQSYYAEVDSQSWHDYQERHDSFAFNSR